MGAADKTAATEVKEVRLVEINGKVEHYESKAAVKSGAQSLGLVDLLEEKGRIEYFLNDRQKFLVQTFSGMTVCAAEECLSAYEPSGIPELDGFDVIWPGEAKEQDDFTSAVAANVNEKGFCVIQTYLGDADARAAAQCCQQREWGVLQADVEEDYLGTNVEDGKVCWLHSGPQGLQIHQLRELCPNMDLESLMPLQACDTTMTNLAAFLFPHTVEFEDNKSFTCWGRSSTLARTCLASSDDDAVKNTLGCDDPAELDLHVTFANSKKLCIIYLIDNAGGNLEFSPNRSAYEYHPATVPLSKNLLVVFRCDHLGLNYSYKPAGKHFALQSWVLDLPPAVAEKVEELRVLDGPEEPQGVRNNVMSIQTRYPGLGFSPRAYWDMLTKGTDAQVKVPIVRWDTDIYYRGEHTIGFSMSCHGGHLQDHELESFDNVFFGISAEEAKAMAPAQRVALELGYEVLYDAGHTASDMNGLHCGVFLGDSGSDWDYVRPDETIKGKVMQRFTGHANCATATRLSHLFGLTGPINSTDTACSSSLVACGMAKMSMTRTNPDQTTASMRTDLNHAVVIGINTMVGQFAYISLSGPGMLTVRGRCFTFDSSADGYARGEGLGAIKLKLCENSMDSAGRLAMLVGSAVNQDGRSASMTAPHGPSQQDVIRQSMRQADLSPNLIKIGECHGTGTALGDPIEVGALRGVLGKRVNPIALTSAKTNLGHLEAAAGVAGLIKCICMLNYSVVAPNNHLLSLNPHLDVAGFPVCLDNELKDYGTNSGLTGVSSFGFGGTNARADVWGNATRGHRFSVTGPMDFQTGLRH